MTSDHIEALKKLRSMSVGIRRQRVAECLERHCDGGDERRVIEIQNAIAAIDAAILDEYSLLRGPQPSTVPDASDSARQSTYLTKSRTGEIAINGHNHEASGDDSITS